MEVNAVPKYDMSDNPTGCCPRFDPADWDAQDLHFKDKRFVRAKTRALMHVPLNMRKVFEKTMQAIEDIDALDKEDCIILSHDPSAWTGEHLFSVTKDVPGQETIRLSGDYLTKVFEGPYRNAPKWAAAAEEDAKAHGKEVEETFFFYTTCPKCAKTYGKNYVVTVSRVH